MSVLTSLDELREIAHGIPRPGCDWEDKPRFGPPASTAEIAALERSAGFTVPADFAEFLRVCGSVTAMAVHNGYWIGDLNVLQRMIHESQPPRTNDGEMLVPAAGDGGGNVFMLSSTGRVLRWDHETAALAMVAPSFSAFLERVVRDWSAYVEDEAGWRYLV